MLRSLLLSPQSFHGIFSLLEVTTTLLVHLCINVLYVYIHNIYICVCVCVCVCVCIDTYIHIHEIHNIILKVLKFYIMVAHSRYIFILPFSFRFCLCDLSMFISIDRDIEFIFIILSYGFFKTIFSCFLAFWQICHIFYFSYWYIIDLQCYISFR